jgi:hypothetical protein
VTVNAVRLDDQYVPLRGEKRLRALGSASDVCRLIASYSLALAAASIESGGLHPGFVVLDEPLQQNPDDPHREQFASFLSKTGTLRSGFQTIIFTYLRENEVERLRKEGLVVRVLDGEHFLELEKLKEEPPPVAEKGDGREGEKKEEPKEGPKQEATEKRKEPAELPSDPEQGTQPGSTDDDAGQTGGSKPPSSEA